MRVSASDLNPVPMFEQIGRVFSAPFRRRERVPASQLQAGGQSASPGPPPPGTTERVQYIHEGWRPANERAVQRARELRTEEDRIRALNMLGAERGERIGAIQERQAKSQAEAQEDADRLRKEIRAAYDAGDTQKVERLSEQLRLTMGLAYGRPFERYYGRGGAGGLKTGVAMAKAIFAATGRWATMDELNPEEREKVRTGILRDLNQLEAGRNLRNQLTSAQIKVIQPSIEASRRLARQQAALDDRYRAIKDEITSLTTGYGWIDTQGDVTPRDVFDQYGRAKNRMQRVDQLRDEMEELENQRKAAVQEAEQLATSLSAGGMKPLPPGPPSGMEGWRSGMKVRDKTTGRVWILTTQNPDGTWNRKPPPESAK